MACDHSHRRYMNDDMMLGRAMPKSLVFTETPGVSAVFLMRW